MADKPCINTWLQLNNFDGLESKGRIYPSFLYFFNGVAFYKNLFIIIVMTILNLGFLSIALLALLFFIDRKIKGGKSVILKIISLAFFTLLVVGTVYFYGTAALESFQVDVRSFSKIKAFFSSRIVALIVTAILVLFLLVSTIHVTIVLIRSNKVIKNKTEKSTEILSVSYDIDVIPDNSVLSMKKINSKRLVDNTLVFSFAFDKKYGALLENL